MKSHTHTKWLNIKDIRHHMWEQAETLESKIRPEKTSDIRLFRHKSK